MTEIYGFTLLRNGIKYDYSYHEALLSLAEVTQKIYLALGKSDDGTEESLKNYDFLKFIFKS